MRTHSHTQRSEQLSRMQGATLLVSASKELVCVYTVGFERSLLTLVCSCKPPSSSRASLVAHVSCSPDGARNAADARPLAQRM